jgi:RNA-directed DNA polymerase
MQETFDNLYKRSQEGEMFNNIYELITSRENILLAYRTIKSNKGSKTEGTDRITIDNIKIVDENDFVNIIRNTLKNYKPKSVRRVLIPKANGKKRPLGIPSMRDRLIQQMFKQILEPIAEAKFFNHSYGFRPLRKTQDAISRCMSLINRSKLHYVVDIDIEGFFDNVNHNLLKKQIWNLGIRDKRVISIISKMLKAPIKGEGIPNKGTPQGGILSPLLSNIVLNDLDQWVAKQWELFDTEYSYARVDGKYKQLRKTNLKTGFIVRYADDFKILTDNHKDAYKWFHAVKLYLKDRLKLDISKEKSKVINLRKSSSEFLGFTLKVTQKGNKFVTYTKIKEKKKTAIINQAKEHIDKIYRNPTVENMVHFNQFVLGTHNYFKFATHVSTEFREIDFRLHRMMYNRFGRIGFKKEVPKKASNTYKKFYKNNYETWSFKDYHLYPMQDIKFSIPYGYSQNKTLFTVEGRTIVHKELKKDITINIQNLMRSKLPGRSVEYMDNRISRYSMVQGKCEITGNFLSSDELHCHHFIPSELGGNDGYDNLRIVHKLIHKLIHATRKETISKYMNLLQLNSRQLKKLNNYRKACNLENI